VGIVPSDHTALALDAAALERLDPSITVPTYARDQLDRSIVHIGVGGFHRAHLATYVDELCRLGHRDWSIVGAGVLAGDAAMASALAAQDYLYTLITRGADHTEVEVIGSIVDYIHAVPQADALISKIADPATQILSLTVTEGGYPVDDVTGAFRPDAPEAAPGSAFDLIAAGLDQRRRDGLGPITVMSCDNIMSNGHVTRTATLGTAERIDGDLASWIGESVAFPNSMVDRITPATGDADRDWLTANYGLTDRWPVVTEPFRQWVVEDSFGGARPPLDELDVIVTTDVEPYELMKLRLLNAGHSCLAYLAALEGFASVDAAMADPQLRRFVEAFLDREAKPALPPVAGIDLDAYTRTVVERFSNPQIGDQIARLCLDGSAKFPKFLLPTVRAQVADGGPLALSALALAGWCEYLNGTDQHGEPIVRAADPALATAVQHAERAQHDPRAFLQFSEVFGSDLAVPGRYQDAFVGALTTLRERGVRSAIDAALQEVGRTDDRSST
jgi:mannitol 2-dehydrogenase